MIAPTESSVNQIAISAAIAAVSIIAGMGFVSLLPPAEHDRCRPRLRGRRPSGPPSRRGALRAPRHAIEAASAWGSQRKVYRS